jgi:potassium efflux system protein
MMVRQRETAAQRGEMLVRMATGKRIGVLLIVAAAAFMAGAPASAQQPAQPTHLAALESLKLSLDQLELAINRDDLSVSALVDLWRQLVPVRDEIRARRADIEPQLAQIEARLKELGAAPAKDAPPEQPAIGAERDQLARQFSELDSALKLARLLGVRADQLLDRLAERRSTVFAQRLFARSPSVLDPFFWLDTVNAVPEDVRSVRFLVEAWWAYAHEHGGYSRMAAALGTLVVFAAAAFAGRRWLRRRASAMPVGQARFAKARAALTAVGAGALALPLVFVVVLAALSAYDLLPERIAGIGSGFVIAVLAAGVGRGVARGFLAPDNSPCRLPRIDDAAARQLAWRLTFAARALGIAIVLNVIHREVVAPVVLVVATNALLALTVGALAVDGLLRIRVADGAVAEDANAPAQWLRAIAWIIVAGIAVALAIGYVGVATFLAERLLIAIAVFAVLYLLLVFIDALFTEVLRADSPRARTLAANFGLTPRSLELSGTLLSAVMRLLLIVVAVLLPFASRGTLAGELFGALQGSTFGLSIGNIGVSVTAILGAIAILLVGLAATRAAQRWLESQFLPRTALDPGLQHSVSTILGYVSVIAVVMLTLAELGIDLQKIALVAGALSVGIGFGLQSIVSNFVSGLILLAERPIRVGDTIVVKGEEGWVRRIRVRATEIETFERASVIIPNSELVGGVVKNWTHANTNGRIIVKVSVAYTADPDEVRDVLMACACTHPQVLQMPAPNVFLVLFGPSTLDFELRCVVSNVDYGLTVKSDLHFAILQRFRAAGIELTYPRQDVRLLPGQSKPQSVGKEDVGRRGS